MTKDDLVTLLRSVGVDENTVHAMSNAYEIGYEKGSQDGCQKHLMVFKHNGEQDEPR